MDFPSTHSIYCKNYYYLTLLIEIFTISMPKRTSGGSLRRQMSVTYHVLGTYLALMITQTCGKKAQIKASTWCIGQRTNKCTASRYGTSVDSKLLNVCLRWNKNRINKIRSCLPTGEFRYLLLLG